MIDSLKNQIVNSIKKAQGEGITLVFKDWGSRNTKCACALGCLIEEEPLDFEEKCFIVADKLNVSVPWVESFCAGFDDEMIESVQIIDAYQLGLDIRKEFNPIHHTYYLDNMDPELAQELGL
jgi:hypothetical protein